MMNSASNQNISNAFWFIVNIKRQVNQGKADIIKLLLFICN